MNERLKIKKIKKEMLLTDLQFAKQVLAISVSNFNLEKMGEIKINKIYNETNYVIDSYRILNHKLNKISKFQVNNLDEKILKMMKKATKRSNNLIATLRFLAYTNNLNVKNKFLDDEYYNICDLLDSEVEFLEGTLGNFRYLQKIYETIYKDKLSESGKKFIKMFVKYLRNVNKYCL